MPWKDCRPMDEKIKFVARLLEGESMAAVCREFGISRKTGYKIFDRYREFGTEGLCDRSRRPYKQANQLATQTVAAIVGLKKQKPHWGAPKIRELFKRKHPTIALPATSTVHAILDRHGLVKKKSRRKKYKAKGTHLSIPESPNDLWCADFKGQFLTGDKKYCYPLTITDQVSRFLLCCEGLESVKENGAIQVFESIFKEYGLPKRIRTDNGVPFASPQAMFNLSRLSVWWLRLGIEVERIKPGNPQQNGRHERMHLTLKKETTRPSGSNMIMQQDMFNSFQEEFNFERPHQALDMKTPSEVYTETERKYVGLPEVDYPLHERVITVTRCGRLCIDGRKINFSTVFAGQNVGIRQVDDKIWQVTFMDYNVGYFDNVANRVEAGADPFGSKVLPMSSV